MSSREVIENVQADLFAIQDLAYRDFQAKLMPTVNKETVIGVRTPSLRAYAKKFGKTDNVSAFLEVLPHKYYEENNLHGLLIEQIKAYPSCIAALDRFLPYIDNWATCDMIALRTVKKTSGHIYPGSLLLDSIGSPLYRPFWNWNADAVLSG